MAQTAELTVRRGTPLDLAPSARLLNEIIRAGGTTALTKEVTAESLGEWLEADKGQATWHVAELDGEVLGFQWIGLFEGLPEGAVEIATFVQSGKTGLGIASKLFDATRKAAKAMGYQWIRAIIRADNEGGLTYYQSRGFRTYGEMTDVVLDDGMVVDKVLKRFDLD